MGEPENLGGGIERNRLCRGLRRRFVRRARRRPRLGEEFFMTQAPATGAGPRVDLVTVAKDEAEAIKKKFEEVGATVEIK